VLIPEMRLLGYSERKPMLRVIRLPEVAVEPAPVSVDRGYALDDCYRREGWLVFTPNVEIWGISIPMEGDPFLVAENASLVALGRAARTIWISERSDDFAEPRIVSQFDGVAREIRRTVEVPAHYHVVGETNNGLVVVHDESEGFQVLSFDGIVDPRVRQHRSAELADGRFDAFTRIAVNTPGIREEDIDDEMIMRGEVDIGDDLFVRDLESGGEFKVPRKDGGRQWHRRLSFSPDGRFVAAGLDCSPFVTVDESFVRLREAVTGRGRYEKQTSKLAIIDCETQETVYCEGEFDNFNSDPIWTSDSDALVFAAPFQPRGLWLARREEARLHWIPFRRNAPVPLCDVSDIIS
jgi:hypothetical protein